METGKIIKKYRESRHMTQQKLAQAVGVSRGRISRWEHSKGKIMARHLIALSECLHVSCDELLNIKK